METASGGLLGNPKSFSLRQFVAVKEPPKQRFGVFLVVFFLLGSTTRYIWSPPQGRMPRTRQPRNSFRVGRRKTQVGHPHMKCLIDTSRANGGYFDFGPSQSTYIGSSPLVLSAAETGVP